MSTDYSKFWNAKRTLSYIEKLNPHLYPEPICQKKSNREGVAKDLVNINDGFLTREQLENVYDDCCNIIHANNPFAEEIDYSKIASEISVWYRAIMCLLATHLVKFKEGEMYLINMEEKDGQVHGYLLSCCD